MGIKYLAKDILKGIIKNINFDTGNISYDPSINKILYTYEDVNKNIKTAVIDTEVLDDKDRSLYKIQKAVEG